MNWHVRSVDEPNVHGKLEDALANLPAPQFEYELGAPEDVDMEEADEDERAAYPS